MNMQPAGPEEMLPISRFYGMTIRMPRLAIGASRFCIEYEGRQAAFALESFELSGDPMPRRALPLLVEWVIDHRSELRENWARAERNEPLAQLRPLDGEA